MEVLTHANFSLSFPPQSVCVKLLLTEKTVVLFGCLYIY